MGDLITLFPQPNPAAPTPAPDLLLSPRMATPLDRDIPVSPGPAGNFSNETTSAPKEPLPTALMNEVSRRSAKWLVRLGESRFVRAGASLIHAKKDLEVLLTNGPRAAEIERLTRAFERETSAPKMQNILEQIAALGVAGIERLAILYKTHVMRASHGDMMEELRRKTLVSILTRAVRERVESFAASENTLEQMTTALMISNRPAELKFIAELLVASGVAGERHFRTIFQSGGTEVSVKGERNIDRFTISAELYLNRLESDLDAEKSDAATEMRRDFKLTLACLRSLSEYALDSDLRRRALELIFELRCRE